MTQRESIGRPPDAPGPGALPTPPPGREAPSRQCLPARAAPPLGRAARRRARAHSFWGACFPYRTPAANPDPASRGLAASLDHWVGTTLPSKARSGWQVPCFWDDPYAGPKLQLISGLRLGCPLGQTFPPQRGVPAMHAHSLAVISLEAGRPGRHSPPAGPAASPCSRPSTPGGQGGGGGGGWGGGVG